MGKKDKGPDVEFDPEDRKKFLLGLVNKKKRKIKEAKQKAKEDLREARRERRAAKKEQYKEVARELCERQVKIGIEPLNLYKETAGFQGIQMLEVDAENPDAVPKESVIELKPNNN